jgi:ATP-dependent protease ClpP protease subunit
MTTNARPDASSSCRARSPTGSPVYGREPPRTAARLHTQGHAELWLYGVVGGYWWGFDAEDVAYQLAGPRRRRDAHVRIHSPGGSVFEGIAIANLLRAHKAKVTVVVDGLAASAASIIAIAGDETSSCRPAPR